MTINTNEALGYDSDDVEPVPVQDNVCYVTVLRQLQQIKKYVEEHSGLVPIDNLDSTRADLPLSANQGRLLKGMIETLEDEIGSEELPGTILARIADLAQSVEALEDDIGDEQTAGSIRYQLAGLLQVILIKADQSDLNAEINNRTYQDAQIRQELQQGLATREPLLSDAQHNAVNSGITATKVTAYDTTGYRASRFIEFYNGYLYGRVNYVRIAPKKGLLSFALYAVSGGPNTYDYISLYDLSNALGVNFKTPSASYSTGEWWSTLDAATYFQFGSNISVKSNGFVELQRAYNAQGAVGGWALSLLGENRYIVTNVFVEEN